MITVSVTLRLKVDSRILTGEDPTIDAGAAQTNGTIMWTLHLSPGADSGRHVMSLPTQSTSGTSIPAYYYDCFTGAVCCDRSSAISPDSRGEVVVYFSAPGNRPRARWMPRRRRLSGRAPS